MQIFTGTRKVKVTLRNVTWMSDHDIVPKSVDDDNNDDKWKNSYNSAIIVSSWYVLWSMNSIRVDNDIVPANGGKFDGGRLAEFSPPGNILHPDMWQLHNKIYLLRFGQNHKRRNFWNTSLRQSTDWQPHGYLRLILLAWSGADYAWVWCVLGNSVASI